MRTQALTRQSPSPAGGSATRTSPRSRSAIVSSTALRASGPAAIVSSAKADSITARRSPAPRAILEDPLQDGSGLAAQLDRRHERHPHETLSVRAEVAP